jgi:phosphoribosylformylglycinamidine synthase
MTLAVEAPALHRTLGLTDEELTAIVDRLGRSPNALELAMFSVMWSEHCSYKSSRHLLRTLPTTGTDVIAGPGENAGVVRIGEGLAVCFKLESHNHPSAIEPVQGAATGVGGILRDIFAMGARPIAVLDALKFGDPAEPRTRRLVKGVVTGVGGYGNCVGVPTVGGELGFHPSYRDNPLVNVMAVGVVREDRIARAAAPGPGNLCVLYGSATGRDGIGGASVLASATFGADDPSRRPTVQIGDPFAEKLLIEASLELVERGLLVGLQDLGAAGITCAVSEVADRAGTGIVVDLDAVPLRQAGMEPFEVMISESQERMLAIVRPIDVGSVAEVCDRWGLPWAVIGRVTDDGLIRVRRGDDELASIPAAALTSDAIVLERVPMVPAHVRAAPAPGLPALAHDGLPARGMDPGAVLRALLGSPDLGSRAWVTDQYDATVGSDTVAGSGGGAAVLRVKGTRMGLVMATDANARVAALDPYLGAATAVAECARNVAVTGARPLGVTNCLNFGDPERPEAFWQLAESVRGLGDACRTLGLPVTGGNVSLNNESAGMAIAPTAQIGVVGLLEDIAMRVPPAFQRAGSLVVLLGEAVPGLGGSAYGELAGAIGEDGAPSLDLGREARLHRFLREAAGRRLLLSAQDVSGGGLAVTVAECCLWGDLGATLVLPVGATPAVELFGESPGRVVLSCDPADRPAIDALARSLELPLERLGEVGGDRLVLKLRGDGATGAAEERGGDVADTIDVPLEELRRAWEAALPRALGEDGAHLAARTHAEA